MPQTLSTPKSSPLDFVNNQRYADVRVLLPGGRIIHTHKIILVISSDYFRAMFESGMKEGSEDIVTLDESQNEQTIMQMLQFLYLGALSTGEQDLKATCAYLVRMAHAADYYQIESPTDAVVSRLIELMTPDKSCGDLGNISLALAACSEAQLKPRSKNIIAALRRHVVRFMEVLEFRITLFDKHTYLAHGLLIAAWQHGVNFTICSHCAIGHTKAHICKGLECSVCDGAFCEDDEKE